jgi:hypothetical protein
MVRDYYAKLKNEKKEVYIIVAVMAALAKKTKKRAETKAVKAKEISSNSKELGKE